MKPFGKLTSHFSLKRLCQLKKITLNDNDDIILNDREAGPVLNTMFSHTVSNLC